MILDRIITFLTAAFVFFLPWQTALILRQGLIGKAGTQLEGPWQYGMIQLYGLDIIVAVLIACVAARVIRHGFPVPTVRMPRYAIMLLCIMIASAAISVAPARDRVLALVFLARLLEGVALFFIVRKCVRNAMVPAALWVAAGCIQAVLAIIQFVQQEIFANTWLGFAAHSPQNLGDSVVENADVRWLRAYGSFPHPNLEGAFLAIALVMVFWLLSRVEKKWQALLLIMSAPLLSAGLFFTFSREAWLGLVLGAGAAVGALARNRKKSSATQSSVLDGRVSAGVVAFVLCMLTLSILSAAHWEPLSARLGFGGLQRLEKRSISERVSGVWGSIPLIREHPFGVGAGQYTRAQFNKDSDEKRYLPWFSYQPVHNMILLSAAEIGVVGAAALAVFMGWVLLVSRRFPIGLAGAVLLVTVASFDHFFWTLAPGISMFWILIALVIKTS